METFFGIGSLWTATAIVPDWQSVFRTDLSPLILVREITQRKALYFENVLNSVGEIQSRLIFDHMSFQKI